MIKIIHIYKDFDTFNGLIQEFFVIAKYIDRSLFDARVCVFNYKGGKYGKKYQELGGKLCNLNFGYGVKGILNTVFRLSPFLKKQKPDIVVTHDRRGNFFGILAARKAGVPIIISTETTLKDASPTRMKRLRDRLFHSLLSHLVSFSDAFMLNSDAVKQQWKAKKLCNKSIVIYPPFDLDKYHEVMPPREQVKAGSGNFLTLGYLGRLSEEKGLHYLIGSLAIVRESFPTIKLLVAGTGEWERFLKRLVRKKNLGDHITFLGFQENSFNLLRKIDLLVVPSRSEGFGMIAVEGMAMGIPVIASRVGGLKEILSDGVGVLVPPRDEKLLASAIISFLKNPQEMQRMGERGHKRAFEMFTPMEYIKQLEGLYRRMLQERGFRL
jgi:glycosyltransferase involved in cell wall biosynthesis